MSYPRPAYGDKSIQIAERKAALGPEIIKIPRFETPISPSENFKRAARRDNPIWLPNSTSDFQTVTAQDAIYLDDRDIYVHTNWRDKRNRVEDYTFTDWFNTNWTWVASAGGAMLTPGTKLVEDIAEWERYVTWPVISEWDFKKRADDYMKNEYDPDLVMHYNIGRGCSERFISLMGGYTEGMLAMAEEPEAVRAFYDRYVDFEIELFDTINALYPLDMVTYHDDWGTERDTFFSESMMETLLFEPTKKFVDYIKGKGVLFELHSCGNITRFLPYMADLGVDFIQIQRRAVDIPAAKNKYGDRMGFCAAIEGYVPGAPVTNEELTKLVRNTVDLYGKSGGCYASIYTVDPEQLWAMMAELYAYSREYYDKEQGRA